MVALRPCGGHTSGSRLGESARMEPAGAIAWACTSIADISAAMCRSPDSAGLNILLPVTFGPGSHAKPSLSRARANR